MLDFYKIFFFKTDIYFHLSINKFDNFLYTRWIDLYFPLNISIVVFLIYVIKLILFGVIYLLFSSNEVCAWGSCQEIPRYLTTNGKNIIITISVLISIFNIFSIYKAYKGEFFDIPGLNEILNHIPRNLHTKK